MSQQWHVYWSDICNKNECGKQAQTPTTDNMYQP